MIRLSEISPLGTLLAAIRTRGVKVVACWQARVSLSGKVEGPGRLYVGCAWRNGIRRPSQLLVRKGGRLAVKGRFRIFENSVVFVNDGAVLRIGSGYASAGLKIDVFASVTIRDGVFIAENVTIRDSDNHRLLDRPDGPKPIVIHDHVWIGMNVIILKGVTIGTGAVIAAGSVVTRDVAPGMLAAGVPAREIRPVEWV